MANYHKIYVNSHNYHLLFLIVNVLDQVKKIFLSIKNFSRLFICIYMEKYN